MCRKINGIVNNNIPRFLKIRKEIKMGRGRKMLSEEVKKSRLIARLEKRIAELKAPTVVVVESSKPEVNP